MSSRATDRSDAGARARLAELLRRNGCIRLPDLFLRQEYGWRSYKKGWEVRLVLKSKAELAEARQLLRQLGFKPGKPYEKVNQVVLPIYGKRAAEEFMSWSNGA